jgi:hypothetical protein
LEDKPFQQTRMWKHPMVLMHHGHSLTTGDILMNDDIPPADDDERDTAAPGPMVRHERPDLLPIIVLALIVVLCLAGWWLFPALQGFISRQDCISTGRTDC